MSSFFVFGCGDLHLVHTYKKLCRNNKYNNYTCIIITLTGLLSCVLCVYVWFENFFILAVTF